MELSGILSITGHPGLFKLVGKMKNGMLVESLIDGKRMPAYTTQKILALEDISIYTKDEDVPLSDIFATIAEKTEFKPAIDPKKVTIEELRDYLESVLPDYDRDRVYASDVKKLFLWFNLLAEKGLLKRKEVKPDEVVETDEAAETDEKPASPVATKKKGAVKPKKK